MSGIGDESLKKILLITWILLLTFSTGTMAAQNPLFRVDTKNKVVAITFDDGPHHTFTPQLLKVLHEERVKATFFLLGKEVNKNPKIALRIYKEGHELGNHGYSHRAMRHLNQNQIYQEMMKTQKAIAHHVGIKTTLFRPPYGEMVPSILRVNNQLGYRLIRWSLDPRDWDQHQTADKIARHVKKSVRPGDIILFHDGGLNQKQTISAVRMVIRDLKKRGYQFVTVSELMKYGK